MKMPKISGDMAVKLVIGAAVLGVGVYLVKRTFQAVGDVADWTGEKANAAVDATTGLLTGNNRITETARTDAYQGAGVFGTLGAATDQVSGGSLSSAGEWLGGKLYDWTH